MKIRNIYPRRERRRRIHEAGEKVLNVPGLEPTSNQYGNLGDIAKAGSVHGFLLELHRKFGPIASFWWGRIHTVSIASAELFEEQKDLFDRPPELFEIYKPLFEAKSIQFANKEDGWKRREHYIKALTEEAVYGYLPQFQEVADEIADLWNGLLKEPRLPLTQYTSMFALKALLHTLFGNLMKEEKDEEEFRQETEEVWDEMELRLVEPRTEAREKHLQEETRDLKRIVEKMLKDRKANPPSAGDKETLLDLFISYCEDEEEQLAECLEFTTAGLHGLEFLVAFAFYFVAANPDVDQKLYGEIQTVLGDKYVNGNNLTDLVYLRQVLDETLRCSALVPWAARYQDVDSKLGGYDIPKNTPVIHALGVASKNETVWSNPDKFDPERFNEASRDRSKFWFSPFGVGKRECLVRHFPYAAATIVLVTLLRKFKVHLADGNQHPSFPFGVVTHHKEEIFVRLSPR